MTQSAFAYELLGGSYSDADFTFNSVDTAYGSNAVSAMNRWVNTPTKITATQKSTAEIKFVKEQDYGNTGWTASNKNTWDYWMNYYVHSTIETNKYYFKNFSSSKRTATYAHELGHSFGLDDLYDDSDSDKLMYGYGDFRTVTSPQDDDIDGINDLY